MSPLAGAPDHPGVEIRTAALGDLDAVTVHQLVRLRQDVFVVEQECAYADLDGRDLEPDAVQVVLLRDGGVIGTLRVLDDGGTARIGRVALDRGARGQGLAAPLMRAALEVVGERACVLDAQSPLAGFYSGFGFAISGEEFLEDGIAHLPMARAAASTPR